MAAGAPDAPRSPWPDARLVDRDIDGDTSVEQEVAELGRRLFLDRLGPIEFYPSGTDSPLRSYRVPGTSYLDRGKENPDKAAILVLRLRSTLKGCEWLLGEWAKLIDRATGPLTAKAEAFRQRDRIKAAVAPAILGFDPSVEAERLRRHELASGRAVAGALDSLFKLRRGGPLLSDLSGTDLSEVSGPPFPPVKPKTPFF